MALPPFTGLWADDPSNKNLKLSVLAVDLSDGKVLYQDSPDLLLEPASVLKILTSVAALKNLGPEYRFHTEFLTRPTARPGEVDLLVRGGGDPSLTVESLWQIVRELKVRGLTNVASIVLDDTGFADAHARLGQRAYETGASALAFNHNSLGFEVCPTQIDRSASITVLPEEFGQTLGSIKTVKGASHYGIEGRADKFFATGEISEKESCRRFYRSIEDPVPYFGRVFRELLLKEGISVSAKVARGQVVGNSAVFYDHLSPALHEILNDLNHFSNNFIANQLVFALDKSGATSKSFSNGLATLRNELTALGFKDANFKVEDGSGLSHANRLSARMLVRLLDTGYVSPDWSAEFQTSLSVMGSSGTLRLRAAPQGAFVRAKTGSLEGVSSIAGYMTTKQKKKLAFTILINGAASKDKSVEIEERLIRAFNTL